MAQGQHEVIDLGDGATLALPAAYVEFEGLSEAKEWLRARILFASGEQYPVTFISPVRLMQDVEDELKTDGFFFEPNLIVVPDLKRATLVSVARDVSKLGSNYLRGDADSE